MKSNFLAIRLVTAALAAATYANAATSFIEDFGAQYNAIIGGDFSGNSGDTEGRHLTQGNFTINGTNFGYSVGTAVIGAQNLPQAGRDDLVIGGNFSGLNGSNISTVTEDAVVGGTVSGSIGLFPSPQPGLSSGQGTLTTGYGAISLDRTTGNVSTAPGAISLNTLFTSLQAESLALTGRATSSGFTATDDGFGSIGLSTTRTGLLTYNATEAFWDGNKFRTISAPAGATLVINVAGSDIDLLGTMTLTGGITQKNVLVNYFQATTWSAVTLDHQGSVLAASASGTQVGAGINGVAFIGSDYTKTGSGEFHNYLLKPSNSLQVPSQTYEASSIFEWNLKSNTNDIADRGVEFDGANVDNSQVTIDDEATFKIIFGDDVDFEDSFWDENRRWQVFGNAPAAIGMGDFLNFDYPSPPATGGNFSFDSSSGELVWQAVPEPTTALAGLLLAAGLFRRNRVHGKN